MNDEWNIVILNTLEGGKLGQIVQQIHVQNIWCYVYTTVFTQNRHVCEAARTVGVGRWPSNHLSITPFIYSSILALECRSIGWSQSWSPSSLKGQQTVIIANNAGARQNSRPLTLFCGGRSGARVTQRDPTTYPRNQTIEHGPGVAAYHHPLWEPPRTNTHNNNTNRAAPKRTLIGLLKSALASISNCRHSCLPSLAAA